MPLLATRIDGVSVITASRYHDERGFFTRTFDTEWLPAGIGFAPQQVAISQNKRVGTIRGLHWQAEPLADAKVVRCIKGRIFDVVADVRPDSPTYRQWQGFMLDAGEDQSLVLPAGVAHGFQTLVDDSEILYLIAAPYRAELARGIRYDDPAFAVDWPLPVSIISDRDRALPALLP